MASVSVVALRKRYSDGTEALRAISLDIADGEFLVLVGPSGCGKTTVLRTIAGLEDASEGEIRIGSRLVNNLPPYERDIAMVFQSYALYPHMTAFSNIAFPLQTQRLGRREVRERVREVARLLDVEEHLARRPGTLSGGQRQRVAMARALVRHPQVFLMDEPLSNLDAKLRVRMRAEITQLQKKLHVTTVYVTHDQVEAMTMGDRIAVMNKGLLQQVGTPQCLYDTPANLFVAGFIGSPAMNLVLARITEHGDDVLCAMGEDSFILLPRQSAICSAVRAHVGRTVAIGIRPENLSAADSSTSAWGLGRINGVVTLVETLGRESLVHITVQADPVQSEAVLQAQGHDGDEGEVSAVASAETHEVEILALLDSRSEAEVGSKQALCVATEKLHFFDIETGARL